MSTFDVPVTFSAPLPRVFAARGPGAVVYGAAGNTAIKSAYPNTIDLFAALATEPNGTIPATRRSDAVHLNDTGHEIVKAAIPAELNL